jgi:hypothetical protein
MCIGSHCPACGGTRVAELEPGDEIIIKAGAGHPAKEEDATDIVVAVSGFSALTASGVKLACIDGFGVTKTGRHFEYGEYEVSDEATVILAEVEARSKELQ